MTVKAIGEYAAATALDCSSDLTWSYLQVIGNEHDEAIEMRDIGKVTEVARRSLCRPA